MTPARAGSSALASRRRIVRALVLLAATLIGASVLLAIGADPSASAERIRPLSELVDGGLGALRGLGTLPLVLGGLGVAVIYAAAAAVLSHRRRHPTGA